MSANTQPHSAAAGVPAPMTGPARGTYDLIVDEVGQTASWTLTLCDFPQYIASHLHSVSHASDLLSGVVSDKQCSVTQL